MSDRQKCMCCSLCTEQCMDIRVEKMPVLKDANNVMWDL